MQTKPLIYGIVGFLLGGLLVSIAAVTFNKPKDEMPTENTSMSMQDMTDALKNKTGDDFDKEFISTMIEHHQGAIDMAKLSDKQAKHQEIKDLSKEIIEAQEKEIADMKQWQSMWGYSDMPMSEGMQH